MARPLVFDLTHLRHRLFYEAPTGIDRVDLLFARYYSAVPERIAAALHYGNTQPKVLGRAELATLVDRIDARWQENTPLTADAAYQRTVTWLTGKAASPLPPTPAHPHGPRWHFDTKIRPFFRYSDIAALARDRVPEGAIYLNVAQHALETAKFFRWLTPRPDVRAVFFLHDLLPLDYPEFWWHGHEAVFRRRIEVMLGHASALITSSDDVRDRAHAELKATGRDAVPILSCPLPSPLEGVDRAAATDPALAAVPYFVVLGTVEPRKNHILLLNVWRRFAARGGPVPKLVVVGKRGWENEQTIDMLERCPGLSGHVFETADLSAAGITRLLANARALLMPSFAEGYGLPVVEALSLGTPVLASDIRVFRDVAQGRAVFRDPVDGLGWAQAIEALADTGADLSAEARTMAAGFSPPSTAGYFDRVDTFLASL